MNSPSITPEVPTRNDIKATFQAAARDAGKQTLEHIVQPVAAMAHDARQALQQGAQRAQDTISESLANTRKAVVENVDQAQQMVVRQREQASAWIQANPFAAIGLAVLAGMALTSMCRRHHY